MSEYPSPGELPSDATQRLRHMRGDDGRALFTSDLSVNEFLLVREAGFSPLGLVLGCSVYHVGLQFRSFMRNQELTTLTAAFYHARELAMARMQAEAEALGADGIVAVRLTVQFRDFGDDIAEFLAVGTAVRADEVGQWRQADGKPFTSDLSGQDFWVLLESGYAPLGLVMGSCVYHVGRRSPAQAINQSWSNIEIAPYTEARYDARELAMARMQAEAEGLGAEGIVGVQLLDLPHRWGRHTTEFFAIGTAIRPMRPNHTIARPSLVLPLTDVP